MDYKSVLENEHLGELSKEVLQVILMIEDLKWLKLPDGDRLCDVVSVKAIDLMNDCRDKLLCALSDAKGKLKTVKFDAELKNF